MLKKQKIKILSIVAGTVAGAGVAISTPIVIALNKNQDEIVKKLVSTKSIETNANASGVSESGKSNYWIATGLAIGYGVISLIIACIVVVLLYKNRIKRKEQISLKEKMNENVINDELAIKTTEVYKNNQNVEQLDDYLEEKGLEKYSELRKVIKKYLDSYVKVDSSNPANVRKYYDVKKESYVPNVVYLKACPEHNFLFNGKNIIAIEKPFDNDKKDILIYDLWSHKITGYSKVVEVLETNKKGLYEIIKDFSVYSEKDFNELYVDTNKVCLLFCDNTVRFEYPVDPETVGVESLKVEEEPLVEQVVVLQQPVEQEQEIKIIEEIQLEPEIVEEIIIDEPTINEIEIIEEVQPELEIVEEIIVDEPAIKEVEIIENDKEIINELAKQSSKVEPVITNDVEVVKAVAKDEIEDIIKANEQTPSEIIREDEEIDSKFIYHGCKIKTIIDKQTRKNAPVTFLVTKTEKNNVSNTYEINVNKNKHNNNIKNQKVVKEYTYDKKRITNFEIEMLKKEGKFYKFKPSTHPKVREEQIKVMNEYCDEKNINNEENK